jgi:hypothetical protein
MIELQPQDEPAVARPSVYETPGVRDYLLVCGVALAVILLVGVLDRGMACGTLVPVLIGVLGLITRWSSAPLLLVFTLVGFELVLVPLRNFAYARDPDEFSPVGALLLSAAVLAYVAAHYRLQGLVGQLFPADPRRPGGRIPRRQRPPGLRPEEVVVRQRRSPRLVTPREVLRLVVALPVWALLGLVLWYALVAEWNFLELPPVGWRLLVLAWLFGLGLLAGAAVLQYLGLERMPPAEAALLLQDELWRETRGEQRRINRWLAWARLVGSKKRGRDS